MKAKIMFIGAFAASALVSTASAATYTATLPEGVTNTLAEAFANMRVTSSEGTATLEGLYAASELQVTGGGRLEIDVNLKSAGFAGEIRVKPGATLRVTSMGALGDTAHGTFVENGATLENECLDTSGNSKLNFADEPLTFAGMGVNGVGALVARTPSKQERDGVWGGTVLTMSDDAMISTASGYQDFPNNSMNNSLDMNGHTLIVRGIPDAKGAFPNNVCLRPVVTNPGHIVLSNCLASINDYANLEGTAANTLTVTKGCRLELYGMITSGRKPWTLIIKDDAVSPGLQTTSLGGRWEGPIVFEEKANPTRIGMQGQGGTPVHTNRTVFAGPITSTPRLQFYNSNAGLASPYLTLSSPDNSFANGVSFANLHLTLEADGALPRNCGTAVVNTTTLDFRSSVASYALPVLYVNGNAEVGDAHGSWAGLVKDQDGTLAYDSSLAFPELTINGGAVKMGGIGLERAYYAGLHYGYDDNFDTWYSSDTTKRRSNQVFYDENWPMATNKVVSDFLDLKLKKTAKGSGTMYTGYIMNNGTSDVTWRFASCCQTLAYLKINGEKAISRQESGQVAFGNAVLHPGANSFKYVVGSNGAPVIPNPPSNNVGWDKGYGFACCTNSLTSTDVADFFEPSDPGDGSLFRISEPGSAYDRELAEAFTNRVMSLVSRSVERVAAAKGTTLDICDGQWTVSRVEGPVAVRATDRSAYALDPLFTVTGALAANGADLVAGDHLTSEVQLVFADGAKVALSRGKATVRKTEERRAVIATSTLPIRGDAPVVETDDGSKFKTEFSVDRKTLSVVFEPTGLALIVK